MPSVEKQRERLIGLLKELFQLDQPDLDFGFYKIMHAKADRVTKFLEKDLLSIIKDAFGDADAQKTEEARLAYEAAIKQAKEFGAPDPETTEPVKKAKAVYEAEKDSGTSESEVYDHLYRFFERYYDNGDFMSRRYYARETDGKAAAYSVPYDGREVYLHWANRDQYYIKTSEYLNNFTFDPTKAPEYEAHHGKIDDTQSVKVHCRIVDATEGEHNNVKAPDKTERYFIIHAEEPVKLENDELVIQFEYRSDPEKTGQENTWRKKRLEEAIQKVKEVLASLEGGDPFQKALVDTSAPTEKETKRTLLAKYLMQYTARNVMDYFIHKDLGGFLRRELDFYIKNEIMRLDDIESADAPRVELYLSKIKVLRKIAHHLIDFLTQLEEFQKKLWVKKKFVLETNYCITLDRISEHFYEEIAANDRQREEWIRLFAIDEIEKDLHNPGYSKPMTVKFLQANPFLVLDTGLFNKDFKDCLLAEMQDLDEKTDGLLIHSENFQALSLLQDRYREQVKCIHIDPPFNTESSGFLYKNSYRHSSWISMMNGSTSLALNVLKSSGAFACHIDEYEMENLHTLLEDTFGQNAGTLIWDKGTPTTGSHGLATQHEYVLWRTKGKISIRVKKKNIEEIKAKVVELLDKHRKLSPEAISDYRSWLRNNSKLSKSEKTYDLFDEKGRVYRSDNMSATDRRQNEKFHIPLIHPETQKECPVPNHGWRYTPETLQSMIEQGIVIFGKDHTKMPRRKTVLEENESSQMPSIYKSGYRGKVELDDLGVEFPFAHSTEFYGYLIFSVSCNSDIILDYFAGSGTTGHAVINLNRGDNENRKYILVEMGEYFDEVTKPRIQKVVYSKKWKDGKPVSREGISHTFKYIRLESYEDASNNLKFQDDLEREKALEDSGEFRKEYMLRYWLETETRESPSLLNIKRFEDPTAYTLKIKKPGSDEYIEKPVDLIETFNWLIGLHVDHIDAPRTYSSKFKREEDSELPEDQTTRLDLDGRMEEKVDGKWWFRKVEGRACRTPGDKTNMDRVLIIWRKLTGNLEEDNLMLDEWFKKYRLSTQDTEFDLIYVNGSNNLPNLRRDDENWKVRLTEETFHQTMWDVEE
jgi:adenine-specific DNA-methyltransferase